MKYQDLETRMQQSKIRSILSRLEPSRISSNTRIAQQTSRSTFQNQNLLQPSKLRQQKLDSLAVDILQHQKHNILVFVPTQCKKKRKQSEYQTLQNYRYSRQIMSKAQSKLSRFTAESKNSFRVKKCSLRQQLKNKQNKQNKTTLQLQSDEFQPILIESKVVKKEQIRLQYEIKKKNKIIYVSMEEKPDILNYLIDHKYLSEFQKKYKKNQERITDSELILQYKLIKTILKQNTLFLKQQQKKQIIKCSESNITFLLNTLYSYQPNLIKKLFGKYQNQTTKLILNFEGCFRSIPINYIQFNKQKQYLQSQTGSLWAEILSQGLTYLYKNKNKNMIKPKQLFQILTGLVMQQIKISQTSQQKLLQIVSSLNQQSKMILGQVKNGQFSTIHTKNDSYIVKRYIFQSVCSQFQPKASGLVDHLIKNYKTIRIADFYPNYYFIYKQIDYCLGVDSHLKLQIEDTITLILQISKQTIAFDTKIKLSLDQKREEGIEQIISQYIKSSRSFKKQITLLPGSYCLRLSDDKQSIKEFRFPIVLGIVCKKNIQEWIKTV